MYLFDSFTNFLSGLGVPGRDKMTAFHFTRQLWTRDQLEAAFQSDWIARKAISIPAHDATREWRAWQAEQDQIELLEATEKRLGIQLKLQKALTLARLYGGACMLIGVDGDMKSELDPESIGKDGLKFVHVFAPHQLVLQELDKDIGSPYYGQPLFYTLHDDTGKFGSVDIHPSRMVRLIGLDTPDPTSNYGWGDPVLQMINDAVAASGTVMQSIAAMIGEAKFDVVKIPGLTEIFSTTTGTERLIKRFTEANVAKSVINAVVLDGEEEWQRIGVNFTGMPEIMQMYLQIAAGAADIPVTRFAGMSPAGLNATGDSDLQNYYDRIHADQELRLTPALEKLDIVIQRSALGEFDEDIFYEWNSLWQMTEEAKAAMAKTKAETATMDAASGLIPFEALVKGRVNQLIEDGTYPGLEAGIDEAIEAMEMLPEGETQGLLPPPTGMEGEVGEPATDSYLISDEGDAYTFEDVCDVLGEPRARVLWHDAAALGRVWSEEKHPRERAGRFTEVGGETPREKAKRATAAIKASARAHARLPREKPELVGLAKTLAGIASVAARKGKGVVKATNEKSGEHPGKGYSKDAFVDSNGVIHTTNVYDAQRALFEDRRVDLKQPKQVSTLIKRLGETALEMAEGGSAAPTFNLCNVTIKGTNLFCADQIGIPRVEMPVIRASKTADFVKYLAEQGYAITEGREKAANLRASQSELSGEKVFAAMQRIEQEGKFYKRLVISRDDYILDGHHTWAGQLGHDAADNDLQNDGRRVKIARVDIGIIDLIMEAEKWTGGAGKKAASEKAKGLGDLLADAFRAWNEAAHERVQGGSEAGQFGSGTGHTLTVQEKSVRAAKALAQREQVRGGTAESATVAHGMAEATPEAFVEARDKSTRAPFLSAHPAEALTEHTLLLNDSATVGISVAPDGDVQNVFNNGGPKGGGSMAMIAAIEHGGRTLDCYAGFLPDYYHQFGFEEDQRMKFNPEFAPEGWDPEDDSPDIVFMSWRGYGEGGAQGAVARASNRPGWAKPAKSEDYTDDWDAAKRASQENALRRRAGDHHGAGEERWTGADAAGDQHLTEASESFRRAVDAIRVWEEAKHSRVQGGKEAGQFGSGTGTPSSAKVKAQRSRAAAAALAKGRRKGARGKGISSALRKAGYFHRKGRREESEAVMRGYREARVEGKERAERPFSRERKEEIQRKRTNEGIERRQRPMSREQKIATGRLTEERAKPSGQKGKLGRPVDHEDFRNAGITVPSSPQRRADFIKAWNDKIGLDPVQFKKDFTGGQQDRIAMTAHESGGTFYISGEIKDENNRRTIGTFDRHLYPDKNWAYSAYFKIEKSYQGTDIGKKILSGNVEVYQQLGYDKVEVGANLDIGGYAWAKYGYVPDQDAWDSLSARLERKIERGEGHRLREGGGGGEQDADEWSMVSEENQERTRDRWMEDSYSEFLQSEEESWRDSGQPLEDAKKELADKFNAGERTEWVNVVLDAVRKERIAGKKNETTGEWIREPLPDFPMTNEEIIDALSIADYQSRYGEGRDDPEFEWDEEEVTRVLGIKRQQDLPGVSSGRAANLDAEMRENIIDTMIRGFNDQAEMNESDMDPPPHLSENVRDYQMEYWDQKDEREMFLLARDYGYATYESDEDDEDTTEEVELEISEGEEAELLDLLRESNPKNLWKIADSSMGKELLINESWHGVLDFRDAESFERFKKYISRVKNKKPVA
jgi:uncharacterized protein